MENIIAEKAKAKMVMGAKKTNLDILEEKNKSGLESSTTPNEDPFSKTKRMSQLTTENTLMIIMGVFSLSFLYPTIFLMLVLVWIARAFQHSKIMRMEATV